MDRRNKYMDLFHVDRLSKLPDDIIYQILSFLDIKYVVQTSTLSKRWMHIWKSVTHLNFDSYKFHTMPQFIRFVNNVLSKRNSNSQVSAVELRFGGPAIEYAIESIVNYAYLHSVQKLSLIWFTYEEQNFPLYLFTCHTLKHLILAVYNRSMYAGICHLPESPWDFPALETLNLKNVQFHDCEDKSANLFSKCVNLKELTLHGFKMAPLETFTICAPQLSSLTIRNAYCFPKVLNVVAPQLKDLMASIQCSLPFQLGDYLQLSTVMSDSLEKVSLSKVYARYYNHEKHFSRVFDLFKKLHSAKFLTLDMNIIQMLSSCEDQLRLEPSPFNNLTCLRIDATNVNPMEAIEVKDYFLRNSSNSTFIMDSHP
ncbi:F-box domain, cyclin-like protein [Artemisia annua]|uniref:F-box domain, cyclin-like protein n=1 Tax=Artemisia annua TaxID=35608 RepID=A0A2U1KJL3_ARTAN|nr:F-box domain, cyclin-like protein [Artemisia annua]